MFGYMTEIEKVDIIEIQEIEARGEDIMSLLFHFLDEFLFLFSAEPFFIARVSPHCAVYLCSFYILMIIVSSARAESEDNQL